MLGNICVIMTVVACIIYIIAELDNDNFKGFKIKNPTIRYIIYTVATVFVLLFFVLDIIDIYQWIKD